MNLDQKTAVIIGGSQGIGRALAEGLIAEGVNVTIVSQNKERIEKTASEIGATAMVADVRSESDLRRVAEAVIEVRGAVDLWVNSAGVFKKFAKGELLDMDRAHELMDVNFFGSVLGSRTALGSMTDGVVLNILSTSALDATRAIGAELYAASKWALRGYVDALRSDCADAGVRILSVYPGGTKSHLHDEDIPAEFDNFMEPSYVVAKIIDNLKLDSPEIDQVIKRPTA